MKLLKKLVEIENYEMFELDLVLGFGFYFRCFLFAVLLSRCVRGVSGEYGVRRGCSIVRVFSKKSFVGVIGKLSENKVFFFDKIKIVLSRSFFGLRVFIGFWKSYLFLL